MSCSNPFMTDTFFSASAITSSSNGSKNKSSCFSYKSSSLVAELLALDLHHITSHLGISFYLYMFQNTLLACTSILGKQNVHFSALFVFQLKYTFYKDNLSYNNANLDKRPGQLIQSHLHLFLYIAPEGQEATQLGLRQCSHKRGKYIINVSSNWNLISSSIC